MTATINEQVDALLAPCDHQKYVATCAEMYDIGGYVITECPCGARRRCELSRLDVAFLNVVFERLRST